MQGSIEKGTVVSIHYTLHGEDKQLLDSSEGAEPLVYLHGHGQIIPGLEKQLAGKTVGDSLKAEIEPADGYGEYDESLVVSLERDQFPEGAELEVGTMFELSGPQNETLVVRVTELADDHVEVDGNHPLAGKKLFFDVSVAAIRPATQEELAHGHAHGPGGHEH
jgi:FKBP-type peptidyl-prolyl cis-trans isomerase SlyD